MDPRGHPQGRVHGSREEVEALHHQPTEAQTTPTGTRPHGPWSGDRLPLAEARSRGGGPIAARYLRGLRRDLLVDASAVVEVEPAAERPGHGDLVAGRLEERGGDLRLLAPRVLAPARRGEPRELARLAGLRAALSTRARILAAVRRFFTERGFLEVETPCRVANPGLEPHLRPFPAGEDPDGTPRWLITSPELHLKRFLAAGYERVFEIARAFRDDERGALHGAEFAMLEWYRTHAGLEALASDMEQLVPLCAEAAELSHGTTPGGCDLSPPFDRATYRELFGRHVGVDPAALTPVERTRRFVADVEPALGRDRPLLVSEFPADEAALARLLPGGDAGEPVAARMELYVDGIELANGFDELTDPGEQRRRHEADRRRRLEAGLPAPPLDEGFLEALEWGLPPSAGMALGLDRLVMVLLGKRRLDEVRAFVSPLDG